MRKIDDDFLNILYKRVLWCQDAYDGKHRLAAFKMLTWSIGYYFLGKDPREKHRADYNPEQNKKVDHGNTKATNAFVGNDDKTCKIAMVTSGGMGDHLLFANYVYAFNKKYSQLYDLEIDVVFKDKLGLAKHIFREGDFIRGILSYEDYEKQTGVYDLSINMAGFPKIESVDRGRLNAYFIELSTFVQKCDEYKGYCRSAFRGNAYGMSKLCELEGRKLIQRGDIYGMLGITEEFQYPLFIDCDENEYLTEIGLDSKEFITIQTGIDVIYDKHVKQWPIDHYRELVKLIGRNYPNVKVVQVGNSGEVCKQEDEHFINLVNKTSLEQAKVLMKHSLIHIDIEGGMVHLRHALKGGKSIVLFGPTSIEFFGYSDNCNLRSDVCRNDCYQMTSAWPTICPKYGDARCMQGLTPQYVFGEFAMIYENAR